MVLIFTSLMTKDVGGHGMGQKHFSENQSLRGVFNSDMVFLGISTLRQAF